MSLIDATRPKHWNSVVGQDRAVRVLHAALKNPQFMKRGFIFEGIYGVGKTSVAYLLARALMCTGDDPLGCNRCPSCLTIAEQGIDAHPDFIEVDAASRSGVDHAREIITTADSLPVLGKRRVVLIDEAHQLSRDAMDVYLKPFETTATDNSAFILSTNDGTKLPETIRSRSAKLKFYRVLDMDALSGYLMKIATDFNIQYDNDAIRVIAARSRGIIRDALNTLETVAAIGPVTKVLVKDVVDDTLEDYCLRILQTIVLKDWQKASKLMDEVCQSVPPARVIEYMFGLYGRCVYRPEGPDEEAIRTALPQISAITSIFIKWSAAQTLLADAAVLVVYELIGSLEMPRYLAPTGYRADAPSSRPKAGTVQAADLASQLGGRMVKG